MTLWGKENQTLLGHVTDCLTAMNARIRQDQTVLQTVCAERLNVDWSEVTDCLRYAAVMHDIGKATDEWQKQQIKRLQAKSNNSLIAHALPSTFITAHALGLSPKSIASQATRQAMNLAILGHHGQLHNQSAENSSGTVQLIEEGWQQLSSLAAQASGFELKKYPTNQAYHLHGLMKNYVIALKGGFTSLTQPSKRLKFKTLYCLMVSLLRMCDGAASKFAGEIPDSQASSSNPGGAFIHDDRLTPWLYDWASLIEVDVLNGKSPNRLQQRANEWNGLCDLLNAGCGEGKTAFALLHAQQLMAQGKINRVIFTLPTRFTSNNMQRDFRTKYGLPEDMVGIFHGDSREFLKKEQSSYEDDEEAANRVLQNYQQLDRVYHRPVTISTVDHLLLSFYHGYKYADWAFGNILQSLVVFDELHHYETKTVAAIYEAMAVMRHLRIPHLIMTATIPQTRIDILNARLPGDPKETYSCLVSEGREETSPDGSERRIKEAFLFFKRDECMVWAVREEGQTRYEIAASLIKDVIEHQNMHQIIFVNQVEKAKAVAREIVARQKMGEIAANCEVICYHAEFIGRDRNIKEEQIRRAFEADKDTPCVLIATQIAELSLDISADRMYSEIAPLDDIAQRGGRLHRNGVTFNRTETANYEMIVYRLQFDDKYDVLPYVKLPQHSDMASAETPHLLQRSWDILPDGATYSFDNVREWVNVLYDDSPSLAHPHFKEAVLNDTVFGFKPQDRFSETGEEDSGRVVLRTKEYETFDVVPREFENELGEDSDANRSFILKINEFKYWKANREGLTKSNSKLIRLYKQRDGEWKYDERNYRILLQNYSRDYGVDFSSEPEYPSDDSPIEIPGNIGL